MLKRTCQSVNIAIMFTVFWNIFWIKYWIKSFKKAYFNFCCAFYRLYFTQTLSNENTVTYKAMNAKINFTES